MRLKASMAAPMLHVCVNVVGEHGELDEELAEPYKQEFEDISDVLEQAGFPRFQEPQAIIQWEEADDKRKYHERIPVRALRLLQRAYAAMKAVRAPVTVPEGASFRRCNAPGVDRQPETLLMLVTCCASISRPACVLPGSAQ